MKTHEQGLESDLYPNIDDLKPILKSGSSDTACLDAVFELLTRSGRLLPLVKMMLMPEAWSKRSKIIPQAYRDMYNYLNSVIEPWDGPAAIAATDGNWIGRSTGAQVDFAVDGLEQTITVYTTRPDTLYGATFMVVAADSELAAKLVAGTSVEAEFKKYVESVKAASEGLLREWPQAATGVEKHYGYAFQWFGLALLIALLYVWFQIVRPRFKSKVTVAS